MARGYNFIEDDLILKNRMWYVNRSLFLDELNYQRKLLNQIPQDRRRKILAELKAIRKEYPYPL